MLKIDFRSESNSYRSTSALQIDNMIYRVSSLNRTPQLVVRTSDHGTIRFVAGVQSQFTMSDSEHSLSSAECCSCSARYQDARSREAVAPTSHG